jgi:hypothetical protein
VDAIRWSGRPFDVGPAMVPDQSELEGLVDADVDPAYRLLRTDLRERLTSAYPWRDSRMNGKSMFMQFDAAINAKFPDSFTYYMLHLYLNSQSIVEPLTDRDRRLAHYFLSVNLSFLIDNIHFVNIGNHGCACIFFKHFCFVLERPLQMSLDAEQRLHRDDGPAMLFSDGYDTYALEGILVSRDMIENPNWLTVDRIIGESNQEKLRLMLKRYGCERFVEDSRAVKIAEDDFGVLYHKKFDDDEPLAFVKVINSTPEPDGTSRVYVLRVNPYCRTAKAAVAWTFGMLEEDYGPAWQT